MSGSDFKKVKDALTKVNMTIVKKDTGEYRVNFKGGKEETAYYTTSLTDAVITGSKMADDKWFQDRQTPVTENMRDEAMAPKVP